MAASLGLLNYMQEAAKKKRRGIDGILRDLPLFDDIFLSMQVMNISIVDSYLEMLERDLLREYMELESTPIASVMFVSALSQLWIFGFYELLRTWRQQVREVLQYSERLRQGGMKKQSPEPHVLNVKEATYLAAFRKIERDPNYASKLQKAKDRIEPLFRRIEALRMNLAKHEVKGKAGALRALTPGYARIDTIDGSLYWEVYYGDNSVEHMSRRSIADQCRSLR